MDFNFLFILVFVAMSIADAVSRRRKKRERIEEMEREEQAEQGQGTRPPAQSSPGRTTAQRETDPRAGVEEWEWEGSGTTTQGELPSSTQRSDGGAGTGSEKPRETADSLIPEDLWAILTGEAPQPRRPPPAPKAPEPAAEAEESRSQPRRTGSGGEVITPYSPPSKPSPSFPSMPGQKPSPATAKQGRGEFRERAGRGPLPTRDRPSSPAPRFPSPARAGSERARHAPDLSEIPWRDATDIAAGEIGSEGGSLLSRIELEIGSPAVVARRPLGASTYVRDLRLTGREGLRRAIVLQEVLGPPVALRPLEKRVWEAWDE